MISGFVRSLGQSYKEVNDYENFTMEVMRLLSFETMISEDEFNSMSVDELTDTLEKEAWDFYNSRSESISEKLYPVIEDVYEREGKSSHTCHY
jgi:preprotein translocase subunit SecA